MELEKRCIGNDFKLFLYAYRLNSKAELAEGEIPEGAVVEDLTNAKNLELKLCSLRDGRKTLLEPVISINEIKAEIPAEIQRLGEYCVALTYDKVNLDLKYGLQTFKTDKKVFEIVGTMAEATAGDVTVIADIRAGIDGMSSFEVWQTEMNNKELTVTDYLAYLQKPATDAVEAGELTLQQYVDAAQAAQGASEQAKLISQGAAQESYNSALAASGSELAAKAYQDAALFSEQKAKESQDAAKLSETKAGESELKSKTSETNAAESEQKASASELAAKTSEEATLLSEQKAKESEDASKLSETKAIESELKSKTSETNAKTSETNAKTSETNSKTSETNAKSSETKAKTSETNAKASETAAAASAQQAATTLSSKANQSDLLQLGADLNENLDPALAEILNHLIGRIVALESLIKNGVYKNLQVDSLDVVKSFNIYGATNMVVSGTASPAIVPDFLGQKFINSAGKVAYESIGTSSVSDWKQSTN